MWHVYVLYFREAIVAPSHIATVDSGNSGNNSNNSGSSKDLAQTAAEKEPFMAPNKS